MKEGTISQSRHLPLFVKKKSPRISEAFVDDIQIISGESGDQG